MDLADQSIKGTPKNLLPKIWIIAVKEKSASFEALFVIQLTNIAEPGDFLHDW